MFSSVIDSRRFRPVGTKFHEITVHPTGLIFSSSVDLTCALLKEGYPYAARFASPPLQPSILILRLLHQLIDCF